MEGVTAEDRSMQLEMTWLWGPWYQMQGQFPRAAWEEGRQSPLQGGQSLGFLGVLRERKSGAGGGRAVRSKYLFFFKALDPQRRKSQPVLKETEMASQSSLAQWLGSRREERQ